MARTRPHVKIHLSIADHRKTAEVWSDLAMRGMLTELLRKAAEKYAARRGNWVPLKATDRMEIACDTDSSRADLAVRSLCKRLGYTVRTHSNRWEVHVRKFSNKQGFEEKELQALSAHERQELQPPNPIPIPKQNPIPKLIPNEEKTAPAALPPPLGQLTARTRKPDAFEGEALQKIEAWAAKNGHPPELMQEALERFREWEPQSGKAIRTWAQWVGSFFKIARGLAVETPASGVRSIGRESTAEGKVRRTFDAARRVEARMAADPFLLVSAAAGGTAP